MIGALLLALLAYVPSSDLLLKRAAARVNVGGRSKEVTLSGTLSLKGEQPRSAQLVLRFPFSCKLEGEGGLALSVKGPTETAGSDTPAARLLQLACPLVAYRGMRADEAEQALRAAAISFGADLNASPSLSRLVDRVAYVLGAPAHDLGRPQLWLYKDSHAPARLIGGGADLRPLQYGNPAAAEWFPRVLELWIDGQLASRFEVLEARGMRFTGEEEEYSRPE